ncbi:hypothetical protein EJB05_21335 [Eragrostis curvula]|uniref:Uncharacterized protein n=1 Tax=Eragrostis curvula TaxID=38414 RepID=A0A5J9V303_9POAL|nr:hypothetical protein EJB05_21335 [Eragrostis curvula]
MCRYAAQRPVRSPRARLPRAPRHSVLDRSKRGHQEGGDLGKRCRVQEVRRHLRRRELRQVFQLRPTPKGVPSSSLSEWWRAQFQGILLAVQFIFSEV